MSTDVHIHWELRGPRGSNSGAIATSPALHVFKFYLLSDSTRLERKNEQTKTVQMNEEFWYKNSTDNGTGVLFKLSNL